MKTVVKFLVVVFVLLSPGAFAEAVQAKPSIAVVSSKYQNLFVFKVSRKFKGAMVEVYYSNGDLVDAKPLAKRKMIINFCDVKSGTYTIRVKKNNQVEEFKYERK